MLANPITLFLGKAALGKVVDTVSTQLSTYLVKGPSIVDQLDGLIDAGFNYIDNFFDDLADQVKKSENKFDDYALAEAKNLLKKIAQKAEQTANKI